VRSSPERLLSWALGLGIAVLVWFLLGAIPALAQAPPPIRDGEGVPDRALEDRIRAIIDRPPLDGVHWGIRVVDLATGRVRVSLNDAKRFIPASNMKIVVSAAALLKNGPERRFATELWGVGGVGESGEVRGNLVLPATGDPTLSERFWNDDEAPLRALVDTLAARGVTSVNGALVIDRTAWDTLSVPSSWMVGNVPSGFSAAPAAFAIGEGATEIVVEAAEEPGEPATVRRVGGGTEGFVVSDVRTLARNDPGDTRLGTDWRPESGVHVVRGTIRQGRTDTIEVATRLAEREAGVRLLQLIEAAGIPVRDGFRIVSDTAETVGGGCLAGRVQMCGGAFPVARIESPPLLEVSKALLEPSQNWITEQVMRSLAGEAPLASRSAALDTVETVLFREAGVDTLDLSLQDGSGLSAYNLVTPRAIASVLWRMLLTPYPAGWRDALAAPGEEDSTLEYRLDGFEGRVQAKTGTISNVNSLSGYVIDDAGDEMIFSILTNGSGLPSSRVRRAIDEVVRAIATTPLTR
jgi:D-alanyl-D-alanine carboxypeptidase/D-alanyl-D-alanine-endopeptidase (penicillin-binding protein 4)